MRKDPTSPVVSRFLRQVALFRMLHSGLWVAACFFMALGALVLILRFTTDLPKSNLLWGFLALLPMLAAVVWYEWRRLPNQAQALAFLDSEQQCGGLLMTQEVEGADAWKAEVPELAAPKIRWQSRLPVFALLGGVVFFAAGFFFPEQLAKADLDPPMQIDSLVAELEAEIEVLEESELIDPEAGEELKEQLSQIKEESEAKDPMKTWEALDQLEKLVEESKDASIEEALANLEELAQASDLAETLSEMAEQSGVTQEDLKKGMEEMSKLMENEQIEKALAEAGAAAEEIMEKLQEMAENGQLNEEKLEELAKELKKQQEALEEKLSQCEKSGMCDAGKMGAAKDAARQIGQDRLKKMLDKMKGQGEGQEPGDGLADQPWQGGDPDNFQEWMDQKESECEGGSGGLSRGPGHGKLNFSHMTDENGTKFDPKMLTPNELADLRDSTLQGISESAPETAEGPEASATGSLDGSKAGGGSAHTQRVYPKHRKSVERYFQR